MQYRSMAALALLALVAAGDAEARAEDAGKDNGFAKRLFAGPVGTDSKSNACFTRHYDTSHLAQHRLQKIRAMTLLITAEVVPEDKLLNYSFRLGLSFRDRPGKFNSSGDCGHPMTSEVSADKLQLGCGVDCDGGGISVELARADKSTLIRLDRIRIWHDNKPDDEGLDLSGGADDRVFRLDRADLDECRALITDRKELAAMRHR